MQLDAGRGSRVTRLTLEDLNQLFPVMAMLEGRCAHDAVKRIDAAGVQRLEELHTAMEAAATAGDLAEYYRNNYLIHETVQQYAGNPWLIRVTHDLHRILKMHRGRQLLTPGRMAQSLSEHRELMAMRAPRRRRRRRAHDARASAEPGPGLGSVCGSGRHVERAGALAEGGWGLAVGAVRAHHPAHRDRTSRLPSGEGARRADEGRCARSTGKLLALANLQSPIPAAYSPPNASKSSTRSITRVSAKPANTSGCA